MSLKRIVLLDFVIVDHLDIDLQSGFTVLTGETGAGKSILIDALQLATGARADSGVIREGAHKAEVCAEFDDCRFLESWMNDAGFDFASNSDSLMLRRTIDVQGKSRAWINGSPATAGQLREVGERLLDIHGQHAWQSLTRPDAVRDLLDAYGQISSLKLSQNWHTWREALSRLEVATTAQSSLQRERERLLWQIGELEPLAPVKGQWEELNQDHSRLAHAQALMDAAQGALDVLDGSEQNATAMLHASRNLLLNQEHLEPEFKGLSAVLETSLLQAQDVSHSLRAYLRRTDLDPQRLTELDTKMNQWMSLARKYRCQPEHLAEVLQTWRSELAQLEASADLASLQSLETQSKQDFMQEALAVSKARTKAAPKLAKLITQAMQGLGMQGGQFEVQLQKLAAPQQSGLEEVGFLVAGHAGSTPRPVQKVASGGELSRIALAIAVTTSQLGTAQTLIFDEVDAGVGGAVAETVGRLMRQLGQDRQVLAVTHLPQVAACADHHLVVSKQLEGTQTLSRVAAVEGEARAGEVARMLGGERLSDATMAHAKEMLEQRN